MFILLRVLVFLILFFDFMQGKGSTLGVGRGRAVAMRARVSSILFDFVLEFSWIILSCSFMDITLITQSSLLQRIMHLSVVPFLSQWYCEMSYLLGNTCLFRFHVNLIVTVFCFGYL